MRKQLFGSLVSVTVFLAASANSPAQSADEQAVTGMVERFLTAMGDGDYEALPAMFAVEANISSPAQIDGKWTMANKTFDEWFAARMAGTTRHRFREPVNEFTVHVDNGLAFVRADANYIVDGEVRSNNIDYFTLIRVDGVWKFVNASYVTKAPAHE